MIVILVLVVVFIVTEVDFRKKVKKLNEEFRKESERIDRL